MGPAAPGLAVAVEWPAADDVRVEVFADDGDPRLAAAVELVSPRNKDRPRSREAFAAKCAAYLRRGCGLVVVDVVTTRRADLHADLLAALGAEPGPAVPLACRPCRTGRSAGTSGAGCWPGRRRWRSASPCRPCRSGWGPTWRCRSTWRPATPRRATTYASGQDNQVLRPICTLQLDWPTVK